MSLVTDRVSKLPENIAESELIIKKAEIPRPIRPTVDLTRSSSQRSLKNIFLGTKLRSSGFLERLDD